MKIYLKLSIAVDTRTKKIVSLGLRSKSAHDVKDAKYLLKKLPSKPKKIVADKAYDAEWLHQLCKDKGVQAVIPKRNYGKPGVGITRLRYSSQKKFRNKTYHRREMAESVFGAIKRKFGASIGSISAHTMRAEVYCRAIAHNIISLYQLTFFNAAGSHSSSECTEVSGENLTMF